VLDEPFQSIDVSSGGIDKDEPSVQKRPFTARFAVDMASVTGTVAVQRDAASFRCFR
jgi:hypothetical protein